MYKQPDKKMSKRKVGRPSKYDRVNLDELYKLCLLGLTTEQLAEYYKVAPSTFNEWQTKHPKFRDTIKAGKEEADEKVARSLFQKATGYTTKKTTVKKYPGGESVTEVEIEHPPDTTSIIFWLKNRQPAIWREKKNIEIEGEDESMAKVAELLRKRDSK
jgi:hypothetical protein